MDIFEQWHKIEAEKFNHSPIKREDIMEAIYQKSTSTMAILKTRLKFKMVWVLFFVGMFTGLMLWQIQNAPAALVFGLAALLYGFGYIGLRKYYLKMGTTQKEASTLKVMKQNYKMITGALNFENNIFLAILPAMIFGAVIVPGLIVGDTFLEIISKPKIIIVAIIATVIMGPLVKIVGARMNKYAYGSFISNLEENISEMERAAI